MVSQFCTQKLHELSSLVQFHGTSMLVFCILNLVFSVLSVVENLLVIYALWKCSSIPTIMKKFFLSLALSDLAVGTLGQSMSGVIIAVMLKMKSNGDANFASLCPVVITSCYFIFFLLCCASFLTISVIAVDRLLAIHLHLRYREFVTSKLVSLALIAVWFTSGIAASLFITILAGNSIVNAVVGFLGVSLTTVAYIRIYKAVKYHHNQIRNQQSTPDQKRQKKFALNSLAVYVVFLVCYLPHFFSAVLLLIIGKQTSLLLVYHASLFFVFLNSSLNPVVYFCRYREIREIVKSCFDI